jgi:hypothetical protein
MMSQSAFSLPVAHTHNAPLHLAMALIKCVLMFDPSTFHNTKLSVRMCAPRAYTAYRSNPLARTRLPRDQLLYAENNSCNVQDFGTCQPA